LRNGCKDFSEIGPEQQRKYIKAESYHFAGVDEDSYYAA